MNHPLQTHFYDIFHTYSINHTQAEKCWHALATHYNEPHRHYHNLTHIQAMIGYFQQYQSQLVQANAVALAIYYHDVIYKVNGANQLIIMQSNEKLSADFFQNTFAGFLENGLIDKALIDRVTQLIMLTEGHQLVDNNDGDAKLFLDMDLSILGQPWAVYQHYANHIRKEYAHVAQADYQQGRRSVLKKFLQRPRLYFSEPFYQQYEKQARENLQREITSL